MTRHASAKVHGRNCNCIMTQIALQLHCRNALAHLFLQEGMPILYYGTEQNAGGIAPNLDDFQSREPLWITTGFDTANPTYRFIRMLNW